MPATRKSAPNLLNHFQATKRNASSSHGYFDVKGKRKDTSQEDTLKPATDASLGHNVFGDGVGSQTPVQGVHTSSASSIIPLATPAAVDPSPSPPRSPPQLLQAEHKSPLSVRQDPEKGKLYLLISPQARRKRGDASGDGDEQPDALPPVPYLRSGSPSLDRTPARGTVVDQRQPPQAPRKRRLSNTSFSALHADHAQTPLPIDKKRPSYKALGASQEGGLSMLESFRQDRLHQERPKSSLATSGDGVTTPVKRSPSSQEDSDDDLVITPQAVRERATGHSLPLFATPTKAARFVDPFNAPQPRPQPTMSAGIFSSLAKKSASSPAAKRRKLVDGRSLSGEDDNPFLDHGEAARVDGNKSVSLSELSYAVADDLPLPTHLQSLLTLHNAVEHALVVHLATAGLGGSTVSNTVSSAPTCGESQSRISSAISLPGLISFAALKPLVERTSGRQFGPAEFARLTYLWTDGTASSQRSQSAGLQQAADDTLRSGLGFVVGRQRTLDAAGRRKWDWSLGIELTVSQPERQVTPPLQVSFGAQDAAVQVPRTPPSSSSVRGARSLGSSPKSSPSPKRRNDFGALSSPSSPSRAAVGRQSMSFLALWNNGIEERKAEVLQRLRAWCATALEAKESGLSDQGQGDAATALKESVSALQQARSKGMLGAWPEDFDLNSVPLIPLALLPSLREKPSPSKPQLFGSSKITKAPVTTFATPPTQPTTETQTPQSSAPMSLMERIQAKEASKKKQRASAVSTASGADSNAVMTSFKRRSMLSRLNDVASNLYLLFTTSPMLTAARTNRLPVLPMSEVLASVAKSSKVALSAREARLALDLLQDICPGFLEVQNVAGKEWVRLHTGASGGVGLADVRHKVKAELEAVVSA